MRHSVVDLAAAGIHLRGIVVRPARHGNDFADLQALREAYGAGWGDGTDRFSRCGRDAMRSPQDGPPRVRAVRLHVNRLAQLFALLEPPRDVGDFYRASHDMLCPTCRDAYINHAVDPRDTFLHLLCNGARVKL
jgi:hypothetical protein